MPELPEVETTKTSLTPLLGQTVNSVQVFQPKLRWPMPSDLSTLTGYQLNTVHRRAKYLILDFIAPDTVDTQGLQHLGLTSTLPKSVSRQQMATTTKRLLIHLGMSGSLQQLDPATHKRKHDHLILQFVNDAGIRTGLHYHDPRRFGAVLWHDDYQDKLLTHLGVEPLDDGFNADYLYRLIHRLDADNGETTSRRALSRAIKSVIMDQQIVVGVGNIYATESLYLAGIHPATPADSISQAKLAELVALIKSILAQSIVQGGSSLRDFTVANGQTGYFQQTLHAYGRQGESCVQCGTSLENIKINARASVYCPNCQPL